MNVTDFHRELKEHCKAQEGCEKCCVRLYCYTPFCEKTEYMVNEVMAFLDIAHNRTGDRAQSDHHSGSRPMPCPCTLDMSGALGYERRQ